MAAVMWMTSGSALKSATEAASPCARAGLGDGQPSPSCTGSTRWPLARPAARESSWSSPGSDTLCCSHGASGGGRLAAFVPVDKVTQSWKGNGSGDRRGLVKAQLAPVVEDPQVKPESLSSPGMGVANGAHPTAVNGRAANAVAGTKSPLPPAPAAAPSGSKLTLASIIAPVVDDLQQLNDDLKMVVGSRHPMLMAAAENIFGAGGKRMRPALVFLVSQATAQLANIDGLRHHHKRLAMVTELIHTASLVHDDVLDDSDTRRGKITVHQKYGTRVAVLAGDFMFAQSSWYLANLDNLEVIKLISQVIADFADGEISQAGSLFDTGLTMEQYMDKSYFKTASLLAASTKSAAIFSGVSPAVCEHMFEYGRHLGLAFQVVDDILDFTQTSEQLGKPAGSDLASGNLTAPALYALRGASGDRLRDLIDGEFVEEGSLAEAVSLVVQGGGVERSRQLAREEGELARQSLSCLPEGVARDSLHSMIDYVLDRSF